VELVRIATPASRTKNGVDGLNAEEVLRRLELPIAWWPAASAIWVQRGEGYDIEVWLPGRALPRDLVVLDYDTFGGRAPRSATG